MISVCVGCKNRWNLFERSLQSMSQMLGNFEVVLADFQSDEPPNFIQTVKSKASDLGIKLTVALLDDAYFSKARGHNASAKLANGDILVFSDTDIWYPTNFLALVSEHTTEINSFFPILYSLHEGCAQVIYGNQQAPGVSSGWWRYTGYGINAVHRKTFEKVQWNEAYKSWGEEDRDYVKRVSQITAISRFNVDGMFHLWHPTSFEFREKYHDPKFKH